MSIWGHLLWGLGIAAAAELLPRGIGWVARKIAAKRAAGAAEEAAIRGISKAEANAMMAQAAKWLPEAIKYYENAAAQALAEGKTDLAHRLLARRDYLLAQYATHAQTAQIAWDRWVSNAITLAGLGVWLGHIGQEIYQSTTFAKGVEWEKQAKPIEWQLRMQQMQLQLAQLQQGWQRMMAEQENRAFWASYPRIKAMWEVWAEQQKQAIRQARAAARGYVRRGGGIEGRLLLEQLKGYNIAMALYQKRLAQWEKFYQQMTLTDKRGQVERMKIAMANWWRAWRAAQETALREHERLQATVLSMLKELQKKGLQAALATHEARLKAALMQLSEMLAERRKWIETQAEIMKAEAKSALERAKIVTKGVYDNIDDYLKALLEEQKIMNAKEVNKQGKEGKSAIQRQFEAHTRRIILELGKELINQLKAAGKILTQPRQAQRFIRVR
jgi:predicted transcriptional regulator